MRRALVWGVWWLGMTALWVALAAKTTAPFVVAAGVTSLIAVAAMIGLARLGLARFEARLGWAGRFVRLPGEMLSDSAVLAGALWRQMTGRGPVEGEYREIPFEPGDEDDPEASARRALVTWGVSLPPNTYVVWVDPHKSCLLVHQLVPTPAPPGRGDRKWPV